MAGLAGADREPDSEVSLAGAGWSEEHDVVFRGDEVQRPQMCDHFSFQAAGVVEVELLQRLAGGEPGGADPAFTAVALAGGDFALQAGDEELLMRPGLGAGAFGEPARPTSRKVGALSALVRNAISLLTSRAGLGGGHHATVPSTPRAVS